MSRTVTLVGYALLVATAVALELLARRRGGGRGTTFGRSLAVVQRPWPGRALLLAGWLWLGWHLFVRTHWQ